MDNNNKDMDDKLKQDEINHEEDGTVKRELNRRTNRSLNNMPGQFEGTGPQENSNVGYDPLKDI